MPDLVLRFSRNTSFISGGIRWYTWGAWSHVEGELADGRIVSAQWPRVRILEGPALPRQGVVIERRAFPCTDQQYLAWKAFLLGAEGDPYDLSVYFGAIVRRDWRVPGRWVCSELIQAASEHAGRPLVNAEHLNRVWPRTLALATGFRRLPAPRLVTT